MESNDTVQIPVRNCEEHPYEELVVYCKDCHKAICIQCFRKHHFHHKCEGISKVARDVRASLLETCQSISDGPLVKMRSDLEILQLTREENKNKHKEKGDGLNKLEEQCIEKVRKVFENRRSHAENGLKKCNERLEVHEGHLSSKISNVETKVQSLKDSQMICGNMDIIEMDKELRDMVDPYVSVDTKPLKYAATKFTPLLDCGEEELEKVLLRIIEGEFADEGRNNDDRSIHTEEGDKSNPQKLISIDATVKDNGTCPICMNDLTDPRKLKRCGHIACAKCIGTTSTCPTCKQLYGKQTGNQPDGSITFRRTKMIYGRFIKLNFSFPDGQQGNEHPSPGTPYKGIEEYGYLYDDTEGHKIAKLLNVAFSRKLVFTTGHDGVITLNGIHLMTYNECFGFSNQNYIEQVMKELSAKGVTEESADDPSEYKEYTSFF